MTALLSVISERGGGGKVSFPSLNAKLYLKKCLLSPNLALVCFLAANSHRVWPRKPIFKIYFFENFGSGGISRRVGARLPFRGLSRRGGARLPSRYRKFLIWDEKFPKFFLCQNMISGPNSGRNLPSDGQLTIENFEIQHLFLPDFQRAISEGGCETAL